MKIKHHPDVASLMSYAAGAMPEALGAVVSSHLVACPSCRASVRELEMIGGALLEDSDLNGSEGDQLAARSVIDAAQADGDLVEVPRTRAHDLLDAMRESGLSADSEADVPMPLRGFVGAKLSDVPFKKIAPGVESYKFDLGGDHAGDLRLLRIASGRAMPEHGHGGSELTLVLTGSYKDEFGVFGPGDVADMDSDVEHQPVVTDDGPCICLVASDSRARFKGLVSRIMQPIIGM